MEDEQQEERAAASTREKGLIDQLEEIEKEKMRQPVNLLPRFLKLKNLRKGWQRSPWRPKG